MTTRRAFLCLVGLIPSASVPSAPGPSRALQETAETHRRLTDVARRIQVLQENNELMITLIARVKVSTSETSQTSETAL